MRILGMHLRFRSLIMSSIALNQNQLGARGIKVPFVMKPYFRSLSINHTQELSDEVVAQIATESLRMMRLRYGVGVPNPKPNPWMQNIKKCLEWRASGVEVNVEIEERNVRENRLEQFQAPLQTLMIFGLCVNFERECDPPEEGEWDRERIEAERTGQDELAAIIREAQEFCKTL
jgi:hypothetical protein